MREERKQKMSDKGLLVVISGFSGVGKGTLMKELISKYNNYALSVSATTRAPREGEENGREYYFKSKEEFEEMIKNDRLLEYASYVGNYYGTPKMYVEDMMENGKDVILEIEVQGAKKIKEKVPDAVTVFVVPPSAEELKNRLIGRGTETKEVIEARLARAYEESFAMEDYDYILVNDDLSESVQSMHSLIQSVHCNTIYNKKFMNNLREDMKRFSEGE